MSDVRGALFGLPEELMNTIYFGNTIYQYILFILAIVFSLIIGKICSYILKTHVKRIVAMTKTEIDDYIISELVTPIILIVIFTGLYFSVNFLSLSEGVVGVLNNIFWLIYIIFFTWIGIKLSKILVNFFILPMETKIEAKFYKQLIELIENVFNITIIILATIFVLGNFGYDITALIASFGVIGMAVAFAAQNIIGDIFGGIKILSSKLFMVGDKIQIGRWGPAGVVRKIDIATTRLRADDGSKVILPNKILTSDFILVTKEEKLKEEIKEINDSFTLTLRYDSSARKINDAIKIIRKIIRGMKEAVNPEVYFNEFKPNGVNLKIVYAIKDVEHIDEVKHRINMEIKKEFDKNKIEFALPSISTFLERGSSF